MGGPTGPLFCLFDGNSGCRSRVFLDRPAALAGQPPVGLAPEPGDRVIAADRGAAPCAGVGLAGPPADRRPGLAAGRRGRDARQAAGIPIITAPPDKDETDLELALARRPGRGRAEEIVICAALGGRTDHLLANVLLLARPELAELDVCIADGPEIGAAAARAVSGTCTTDASGAAGDSALAAARWAGCAWV